MNLNGSAYLTYTLLCKYYLIIMVIYMDFGKSRLIPKIDTKLLLQFLLANTNGM